MCPYRIVLNNLASVLRMPITIDYYRILPWQVVFSLSCVGHLGFHVTIHTVLLLVNGNMLQMNYVYSVVFVKSFTMF